MWGSSDENLCGGIWVKLSTDEQYHIHEPTSHYQSRQKVTRFSHRHWGFVRQDRTIRSERPQPNLDYSSMPTEKFWCRFNSSMRGEFIWSGCVLLVEKRDESVIISDFLVGIGDRVEWVHTDGTTWWSVKSRRRIVFFRLQLYPPYEMKITWLGFSPTIRVARTELVNDWIWH